MSVSLKNQVVLVVGASSGIGRAATVLFAREGAQVIASARRGDRLRSLEAEMTAEGHSIAISPADASNALEMEKLGERAGNVDILVFAAGTNTPDRTMARLNTQIWDMMIGANLSSAYYATRAVLPGMKARGSGHLIYVSSISGVLPDVSGASYQAAKRGLLGLAHAIRMEERERGIRTCVVCPGLVDTELLEKRPVKPSAETIAKALQPEDVAEAILAVAKMHPRVAVPEFQILPTVL
jgi:NADP-dependent 3-hydroxy acid dehydrogenase YdfG